MRSLRSPPPIPASSSSPLHPSIVSSLPLSSSLPLYHPLHHSHYFLPPTHILLPLSSLPSLRFHFSLFFPTPSLFPLIFSSFLLSLYTIILPITHTILFPSPSFTYHPFLPFSPFLFYVCLPSLPLFLYLFSSSSSLYFSLFSSTGWIEMGRMG